MTDATRQSAAIASPQRRCLIVNADDFGRAPGINRGVIAAFDRGIVTSASLMVRWPGAVEAAGYARGRAKLGLGLHVDLGEWIVQGGRWRSVYEVVSLSDAEAVLAEADRQLARFREMVGRDPTHLDSHQHVHRQQPVRQVLRRIARRIGVPLRHVTEAVRYCGDFHGQSARGEPLPDAISVPSLIALVEALPQGITEIACHPGDGTDVWPPYALERAIELDTLCDPLVRETIVQKQISLCSFGAVRSDAAIV